VNLSALDALGAEASSYTDELILLTFGDTILGAKENLELMKTLDDAWNAGPNNPLWETFKKRHTEEVKVYWPAQPEPTR
jgi:hypothetical protein